MKTNTLPVRISLMSLILLGTAPIIRAQGPLAPSGPPGATMRSLLEIEPRIPISSAPVTISQPGSYYLTTNLSGTITLIAHHVTLDLNGFAVVGTSQNALTFSSGSYSNVVVRNGTLIAMNGNGVDFSTSSNANGLIERVRVLGAKNYGFAVGGGFLIRDCEVSGAGLAGIKVSGAGDIRNCLVQNCGRGVEARGGSRLIGNTVIDNASTGLILTGTDSWVADNIVRGNLANYQFSAGNQLDLWLSELPQTISWPARVTLRGSLSNANSSAHGLTIDSDDVTVDLAGHALIGSGTTSGSGIYQEESRRNLRVTNGKLVNWRGTDAAGAKILGTGGLVDAVQAATNRTGIWIGDGGRVVGCSAVNNLESGIYGKSGCVIESSTTRNNGGYGLVTYSAGTIIGCNAFENRGAGISAGYGSVVRDCSARDNLSHGILADSGSGISGCAVSYNASNGIQVTSSSRVADNVCSGNGSGTSAGIFVSGTRNRIDSNQTINNNNRGIDVVGTDNLIVRNSASGNFSNYNIAVGNKNAQVLSPGSGFVSTDPWANISY